MRTVEERDNFGVLLDRMLGIIEADNVAYDVVGGVKPASKSLGRQLREVAVHVVLHSRESRETSSRRADEKPAS